MTDNGSPQAIDRFGVGAPPASISIAVAGDRNAGAPQQCVDTWSDWAGLQPSRTALGFDGYQWQLDGSPIAGQTGATYTPGAADGGHQLACKATVTYTLFPVTVSATSAGVRVKGVDDQLADLAAAVVGVGPRKSLANTVRQAQAALARGVPQAACSILGGFANEVRAQSGKKIPPADAADLIGDSTRIRSLLGC